MTFILTEEGGEVDDPRDPGGRTNKGITQATYDAWRRAHGQLRADVYTIIANEVEAIYHNQFAAPIQFDRLPVGIGYCVLDEAVNSGVDRASRNLQACLGITQDGRIGEITVGMAQRWADPSKLIDRLCDRRLTFLHRLKTYLTFGRGWTARVEFVRAHAKAMVVV